jgi:hypothetical protein
MVFAVLSFSATTTLEILMSSGTLEERITITVDKVSSFWGGAVHIQDEEGVCHDRVGEIV